MSTTDQDHPDPFSRKSVRQALKQWYNLPKLGQHPLARLQAVEHARIRHKRAATKAGVGLSLREMLQLAMNQLKPQNSEPDYQDRRWYSYIILKEEFIEGRSAHYLSVQLNDMAQRTYQLMQAQAIDNLASILYELEDEAHQNQLSDADERKPPIKMKLSLEQRMAGMSAEEERELFEFLRRKQQAMK